MSEPKSFPTQQQGKYYHTEGGSETEITFKYGFELPEFAMFPLLDNPAAVSKLQDMYRDYLDVVATDKMCALLGGLDYRASPDWLALLGYSPEGLARSQPQIHRLSQRSR
ncbi:MAG: homocysteine S-methyltransferase [Saprospiraceae bacterium]|jgi:homocysteine S-methyltransferase